MYSYTSSTEEIMDVEKVATPDQKTIEQVSTFLNIRSTTMYQNVSV